MKGIEALEEEMHAEAAGGIHPSYMEVDFKMTFEAMYDIHDTDYEDGASPMLGTAVDILTELEKDAAEAAAPTEDAAPAEATDPTEAAAPAPAYGGAAAYGAAPPATAPTTCGMCGSTSHPCGC